MNLDQLAVEAEKHVESGELDKAVEIYSQILSERPDDPNLHHVLGLIHAELDHHESARDHIRQAIHLDPHVPIFHRSLGDLLQTAQDYPAAMACYEQSLALSPGDTDTLLNLGNALHKSGDPDKALSIYRRILKQEPDNVKAILNIGKTVYDQGDIVNSIKYYDKAIKLQPDYAEAQFNRAVALLLSGDYARGWPAYEWRFKRGEARRVYPHQLNGRRWDGSSYGGERLLVHCEQGLGDVIQFCRYLPMVKTLGGTLLFETHAPLKTLLARMQGGPDQMVAFDPKNPPHLPYSQHIPLMSLPGLFNTRPTTIPTHIPYLHADPKKVADWQNRLVRAPVAGLRVGMVWHGSETDNRRSCPITNWLPLWQVPGVSYFSLQKGPAVSDLKQLGDAHPLLPIGDQLDDFDDTAAVIANLDLVITIDTAVAHLAGAMGKPVWIILHQVPDWRWLQARSDSPWYPTARLFRQPSPGDWPAVIHAVAEALTAQNALRTTARDRQTHETPMPWATDKQSLALLEQGNQLCDKGDAKAAVKLFQQAIALHPQWAEAHFNLGRACHNQGRFTQAIQAYRNALRIAPNLEEALTNLGLAYHQDGQMENALDSYRQAIALHRGLAGVFNNLGVIQEQMEDMQAAVESYECALKIDPQHADAHTNLGNVHLAGDRLDQAVACYQRTLASDPRHAKALCNLGLAYHRKGLLDDALASFNQALKLNPDYAEAHLNRAITLLLVGDWENGWKDYEWRFRCRDWQRTYPHRLYGEQWKGEPFKDKTLLVHSEQGIGDTLQFARYLPLVKQRGGRLIFEVRPSLYPLFESMDCVDQLLELSADKPPGRHYNMYVPLCSLPRIFGTLPGQVPNETPYLKADPAKIKRWRKRLPDEGLNVGLVWGGNNTYRERSCSLADLAPLGFVKAINWIGLQKGPAADQAASSLLPPNFSVTNWGEDFKDFSDTAAAVHCLDLVISIDTSVAHLAGAMGKPVWILLPMVPDWRWLLERSQSPWYPTMHLFRKSRTQGWSRVVAHLISALERWRRKVK